MSIIQNAFKICFGALILLVCSQKLCAREVNFIALDVRSHQVVMEVGPSLDQRFSPCCTFNIALSAMGYELGILQNESKPVWPYDGSWVPQDSHKAQHSPMTWMDLSVVWCSKQLIRTMGRDQLQKYITLFAYGNQDGSGTGENGYITAHLSSSLRISPKEQTFFLRKFLDGSLPVSPRAICLSKQIIPHQALDNGWMMFGKTGSGFEGDESRKQAWYVGWIEKGDTKYAFALLLRDFDSFPTREERIDITTKLLQTLLAA